MRVAILITILILFGLIGYEPKRRLIEQKKFLLYLENLISFISFNIGLFKTNIKEIINKYNIQQINKNAKYDKIFIKNNKITIFDTKIIKRFVSDSVLSNQLITFFDGFGVNDFKSQKNELVQLLSLIKKGIEKTNTQITGEFDLKFKVWLSCGVVFVILLW